MFYSNAYNFRKNSFNIKVELSVYELLIKDKEFAVGVFLCNFYSKLTEV